VAPCLCVEEVLTSHSQLLSVLGNTGASLHGVWHEIRENWQNQKNKQDYFIPHLLLQSFFFFPSANCPVLLRRRKN